MRWIVDTSAWAHRDVPGVAEQLAHLLEEDADSEFVLSPSALLELIRGPQGEDVATERTALEADLEVLAVDAETYRLAANAMVALALHAAEAHRLPIPDLVTAALAHQHGCGVAHIDIDFEILAEHSGLTFQQRRIDLPPPGDGSGAVHPVAADQRALVKELRQLLHRKPAADAEAFLAGAVQQLRDEDASDGAD